MTASHRILAIECSHLFISVALDLGGRVLEERADAWQKTAETMVPLIDGLLVKAGVALGDLDALAISSGPGSFTALRIGMATAKGLAFGAGLPLIPVSTMEALVLAAAERFDADCIVPVIPARKGEYYYTLWSREAAPAWSAGRDISFASAVDIAALAEPFGSQCVVVGRELAGLRQCCARSGAAVSNADFFSAEALIPLAQRTLAAGCLPDPASVVPDYHQKFRPHGKKS
ncbi:peptidase M22 glycoprotease [Prosthecochloris aestuarii DSM 271]|uniref:Peptidase M22 glycoprotease n=1 Tax=Prosthecochloris aestuarii (strain DSM 271 / SK 413) TaxID=290512 RepID=B4S3A1_PROA2|nr:tRNA (adenosine(37)-N6)-threonylcarbamoyltransferase complex dimerization subunit type 1 TsaB [Prosthecochloris aestuarii]ACF45195.1 peptidase M22 glycoprotease [Prosthecochloris aestuarii DSM 271]